MRIHSDPDGRFCVWESDCKTVLCRLPDASIDSIVTDPPYGLEFMGKEWDAPWKGKASRQFNDIEKGSLGGFTKLPNHSRVNNTKCELCDRWKFSSNPCDCDNPKFPNARLDAMAVFQQWFHEIAVEALRVLKPGGHLLAFGGTRTYHRMACAIEDAGFEIRDSIHWVYGSGFPKSLNVKKSAGNHPDIAEGLGTALKPAHEPIVVARKPLIGTVAQNVLTHGTGALNIDATRVGTDDDRSRMPGRHSGNTWDFSERADKSVSHTAGRWPANVIYDGSDEVVARFPTTTSGTGAVRRNAQGSFGLGGDGQPNVEYGDSGSAARFFPALGHDATDEASFMYCAKPGKKERNAGLEGLPEASAGEVTDRKEGSAGLKSPRAGAERTSGNRNTHPTVKPIALMRWLIRLVTPPGGIVLDPFLGSGTTAVAALLEGKQAWGCEMTEDYIPIILGRIGWAIEQTVTDILF